MDRLKHGLAFDFMFTFSIFSDPDLVQLSTGFWVSVVCTLFLLQ